MYTWMIWTILVKQCHKPRIYFNRLYHFMVKKQNAGDGGSYGLPSVTNINHLSSSNHITNEENKVFQAKLTSNKMGKTWYKTIPSTSSSVFWTNLEDPRVPTAWVRAIPGPAGLRGRIC